MTYRIARILLVVGLTAALVIPFPLALACGPSFPVAIFIQVKHPDLPLAKYAGGSLGVVKPSYARSYLVVAYRYLSGGAFTPAAQRQLLGLWAHRLDREQEWLGKSESNAAAEWLETRNKVGMKENPSYIKKDGSRFPNWAEVSSKLLEYDNCSEDAFWTAAQTLRSRTKQFGPDSEAVRTWIEAQDAVFRNCGGSGPGAKKPYLPPDTDKNLPALLRADREYQFAAAHFYAQDWDEAERRFLRISQDVTSPWKNIAAIVAVRCELRKALLSEDDPKAVREELASAEAKLVRLEADPSMRELRPAIWRMRGYVEFRLTPEKRLLDLARTIETDTHRKNLQQDLDDYTQLLDREIGDSLGGDQDYVLPSEIPKLFENTSKIRGRSPMTDWILTYQASGEEADTHARAKWKETRSDVWLIAALSKAGGKTPELEELLDSANKIPLDSKAYLTATYHRCRLLAEIGKVDEARQIAKSITASPDPMPASARNLFLALRMKLARDLDEFLEFASRQASLVATDDDRRDLMEPLEWCTYGDADRQATCLRQKSLPALFDADASIMLTEGMPTNLLSEAAKSQRLPDELRRQVAQAAWVRAVLLDDEQNARTLTPVLASLSPELSPMLKSYDEEQTSESRRFAAAYLILHRPELHPYVSVGIGRETRPGKIDSFRDNWWCPFKQKPADNYEYNYYTMFSGLTGPLVELYGGKKHYSPAFLSEREKKVAGREWEDLGKIDGAPAWLGNQTFLYAKAHPDDPRVPEALHLVVRATRYACSYSDTASISKSAFTLLHRKYPKSEWTKKTPYWY